MEILFIILIFLVIGRIFGEIANRLKLPSLLGEIIAGILLGTSFSYLGSRLPVLTTIPENEVFNTITDLGIFFLMLYAGIELRPKDVGKASISSIWIAVGGMLLPLALGLGLGFITLPDSELKTVQVIFLGVSLAITAVPVAIKVLIDMKRLNHPIGKIIVSAAVIDDVLGLVVLATLTAFIRTGEMPEIKGLMLIAGKVLLFFLITLAIGKYLLPAAERFVIRKIHSEEIEFSFLMIVALTFSVLAELMEMHFILGAFLAGLFFVKRDIGKKVYEDVQKKVKAIAIGFLAPIFFVSIGLQLDLTAFTEIPWFVASLIILASAGKVLGAGIPALLTGFSKIEALAIGNAMNARGAVELIIADIALKAGLFRLPEDSVLVSNLFSAVVIMAIVTTIATPIVFKLIANKIDQ